MKGIRIGAHGFFSFSNGPIWVVAVAADSNITTHFYAFYKFGGTTGFCTAAYMFEII